MAVTVHLGPARLIPPPIPPEPPPGELLFWTDQAAFSIQQGGTYALADDVTNNTGDPATYSSEGPYANFEGRGLSLNNATGVITASSSATVGTTPVEPDFAVVTPRFVEFSDAHYGGTTDGYTDAPMPKWHYAHWTFQTPWANVGGDWLDSANASQGTADYLNITLTDASQGNHDYPFPLPLLAKLRTYRNSGIYVRNKGSGQIPRFSARWMPSTYDLNPDAPQLTVVTNVQTYVCACEVSVSLGESNQSPGDDPWGFGDWHSNPDGAYLQAPFILRFNLSAIQGTPSSATLRLFRRGDNLGGTHPYNLGMNFANPPKLIRYPAAEVGNIRQGIAATVATDQALASHADVLFYQECSSANHNQFNPASGKWTRSAASVWGTANELAEGGHTYVTWPDYGMGAVRVFSGTHAGAFRIIQWWGTALTGAAPQERLFIRYGLRLDPNMGRLITQGFKLPGMEESYVNGHQQANLSHVLGGYTNGFSDRAWMTNSSKTIGLPGNPMPNDGMYRLSGGYVYDATDAPNAGFGGPMTRITNCYLEADTDPNKNHIYWIEKEVLLNTAGQSNGQSRTFVDGVLVYEKLNSRIREGPLAEIFAIPDINIYHGGSEAGVHNPQGTLWFEISGICMAKVYIGPPKKVV